MAEGRGPRLVGDIGGTDVYKRLAMQQRVNAKSYVGVPLELRDGTRVGSLAAVSRRRNAFSPADEQLFIMLARVLASELERESNARDLRRFNDMLRDQAKGMGAIGRVAKALATGDDARQAICEAACEVMDAPVAFLLEPSGRDFASTAMAGVQVQPVTIQPRGDGSGGPARPSRRRRRTSSPTPATTRRWPPPLVEATRRALRRLRADPARRRRLRRADRDLAALAGRPARGLRRAAAAGRLAGRDRHRACRPAGPRGRAGADRFVDRPGHPPRLRRGAAARAGACPSRRLAGRDRRSWTSTT